MAKKSVPRCAACYRFSGDDFEGKSVTLHRVREWWPDLECLRTHVGRPNISMASFICCAHFTNCRTAVSGHRFSRVSLPVYNLSDGTSRWASSTRRKSPLGASRMARQARLVQEVNLQLAAARAQVERCEQSLAAALVERDKLEEKWRRLTQGTVWRSFWPTVLHFCILQLAESISFAHDSLCSYDPCWRALRPRSAIDWNFFAVRAARHVEGALWLQEKGAFGEPVVRA